MNEMNNEAVMSQDLATVQRQLLESEDVIRNLRASLDNSRASELRALNLLEAKKDQWAKAVNHIQDSIDSGCDWEQSELEEPFWTELADIMGLNLSLTKEVEVKVTVTYTGTITVPKDFNQHDIDTDENFTHQLNIKHGGRDIEDQYVTLEDTEWEFDY